MNTPIPIYEAKIIGADNTGIFAMSFVDFPANEQNFVALKRNARVKLNLNKHKQILTGVVLIPDQPIYRSDDNLGEYFLKFTAQDIEKIAQKMMRTGAALSTTTHQHESNLKGNYLTELWIVADSKNDKSVALGLGEYPVGTLIASYKIEDKKYWREQVLSGNVRGFSLEGIFNFKNVTMKKTTLKAAPAKALVLSAFGKALQGMGIPILMEGTVDEAKALTDTAKADETDSGDPTLVFDLQDGGEVWVDADGFATLEGEQAPAGEHALADGNFIVIDDSGMLVITQPEPDTEEPATTEAALKAAKERGKQFLAKRAKPEDENAAKIAKLQAEIAKLKKEPSAAPAKPKAETTLKAVSEMTHTEKMAQVLRTRQANRKKV